MVTLYLMGEKGLFVLMNVLQYKEVISHVVCARDKNIQKDYYDEIKTISNKNDIIFYDRLEVPLIETDYSIAVAWRWMIPNNKQLIVLHDSLLPKYRGFAPLVNMLINHEPKIGVTALFANKKFDCGNIILQKSICVDYPIYIHDAITKVSKLYIEIVQSIIKIISEGLPIYSVEQNDVEATYSLWRDEDDYRIEWERDSSYIQQFIYSVGFPYKGASTNLDSIKYRVLDCELVDDVIIENRCPGKVLFVEDGHPIVVCGKGLIKITELQTEDGTSVLPLAKYRSRFY